MTKINEGSFYYELFKYFSDHYNLTLLDSEIQEIITKILTHTPTQVSDEEIVGTFPDLPFGDKAPDTLEVQTDDFTGGNKIYIKCFPTDTGAKCFPNSNFAIKELPLEKALAMVIQVQSKPTTVSKKELSVTHFHVADNSDAFRSWLDDKNIKWVANGHFTSIDIDNDIFSLGVEFGLYKKQNQAPAPVDVMEEQSARALIQKYATTIEKGYVGNLVGYKDFRKWLDTYPEIKTIKCQQGGDERCEYELIVESYFGIKLTDDQQPITIDTALLVDLVCAAHQRFKQVGERQASPSTNGGGWISVEDRLPEDCEKNAEEVVVCYPNNDGGLDTICASFFNGKFYVLSDWSDSQTGSDQIGNATHWQPLPKAPYEKWGR